METKIGKVLIGGQEAASPDKPAPAAPPVQIGKVYINGHEAVHKGCGGMAIAFPDVCLCPPGPPAGPVPVPLTNIVQAKDMVGGALTVRHPGLPGRPQRFLLRDSRPAMRFPATPAAASPATPSKAPPTSRRHRPTCSSKANTPSAMATS
jgi:hypothetical protein